jgi:flagellar motor switch protein FliG
LAEVLNRADRSTEKAIMEKLEEVNPELAEEVKRLMFVFDDLVALDNRTIQQILREVDAKDLALALKGAKEEVKEHLLKNMSSRAKAMIQEDMDVMGPVRLKHAEEAQQKIINVVRQLEEMGEIVVARGGEEEVMI